MDEIHIKEVYRDGVAEYITTIRQCKRLINAFYARWLISHKFCDAGDMLGIVALEIFEPEVFQYILQNRYRFYRSVVESASGKENQNVDETIAQIKDLSYDSGEATKSIIGKLFPKFGDGVNTLDNENTVKRICKEKNFYNYMTLNIASDDVLYDDVKVLFYEQSGTEFVSAIEKWKSEGKIVNVWEKLIAIINNASKSDVLNRKHILFHAVSVVGGFYSDGIKTTATDVCNAILRAAYTETDNDGNQRLHFKKEIRGNISVDFKDETNSLDLLVILMRWVGNGYPIGNESDFHAGEKYADEDVFLNCKDIYRKRIIEGVENRDIFKSENLSCILNYLFIVDKNELITRLEKLNGEKEVFAVLNCALLKVFQRNEIKYKLQKYLWDIIPVKSYYDICSDFISKNEDVTLNFICATLYIARANDIKDIVDEMGNIDEINILSYYKSIAK